MSDRPWTLWAYVVTYVVASVHYLTSIWSGGPTALGWLLGLVLVYRLWRGSRPAWITTVVVSAVYLVVSSIEVEMARSPGGHTPLVHLIEAALLVVMLALLLVRPSRRFYGLDAGPEG